MEVPTLTIDTRGPHPPMSSSSITVAVSATRGQYLLDLLVQVPDPRKKRGRRHPLVGLLAAVIAGSRSFAAKTNEIPAVRDLLAAFKDLPRCGDHYRRDAHPDRHRHSDHLPGRGLRADREGQHAHPLQTVQEPALGRRPGHLDPDQ